MKDLVLSLDIHGSAYLRKNDLHTLCAFVFLCLGRNKTED